MRSITSLSTLAAAIELAHATVYLAGDSTMALSGANDGVTDGTSSQTNLKHPFKRSTNITLQAGAPTSNLTSPTRR
jgi:hypothetical protein